MPSTVAPYGAWRSPISAAQIAAGAIPLGQVQVAGGHVYWAEGRPLEGGRYVLVRHAPGGAMSELTPPEFNVRTRVHEYGGGSYWVHGSTVFFANFADQRLYRQDPGQPPVPVSPEPEVPAGLRYADGRATPDGRLVVCVQERHAEGHEAANEIVVLPADGSAPPRPIVSGHDFVSFPRISPDGRRLAWTAWDHPRMPWDGSELWVGDFAADGSLSGARRVAGGAAESIFQPSWGPDGTLYFVSDRSGWWNLYRLPGAGSGAEPLAPMEAEFGLPQWVFGLSAYTFLPDGRIACTYTHEGRSHLGLVEPGTPGVRPLDVPYVEIGYLHAVGGRLACVAASPTEAAAVVLLDVSSGGVEVLRRSTDVHVDAGYVSVAHPISFPTEGGLEAHALFYPPTNADYLGPTGERPPLLVLSHGGPTAATTAGFRLEIQFWTSRGFAVVDVNYGGSTGYGRAYRERLNGAWGIVDVADCINAARYLAARNEVDGRRLAIRGGSAGGYTTLSALTFSDAFAAGASYFGVADLEALARDTHKFESRYLDTLVGPYPEAKQVYRDRSPIHFTDRLSCPVILFQGLEDRVVPPSQAESMARALRTKGVPHAYLAFEGEQHGFRKAETIQRTLEAELAFYSRVFGFPLPDAIEPVEIENL